MKIFNTPPQEIRELDQSDTLSAKRNEFLVPDDIIYLNGNSLGPLTKIHSNVRRKLSLSNGERI